MSVAWRRSTISVAGVELAVAEAGDGDAVMLVPGWPQSGHAWRFVAPRLVAAGRRVVVVDPRGLGASTKDAPSHDVAVAAADLAEVAAGRVGGPVDLVAHDVGVWLAHAWAVAAPQQVRSMVLVDAGVPGLTPIPTGIPDEAANIRSWHFAFNRLDGLPELLITGREREYLAWLFASKSVRTDVFDEAAVQAYAALLAERGAIRSGMEYYRAAFSAEGLRAAAGRAQTPVRMPVHVVAGERGVGDSLRVALAERAPDTTGVVLAECGHYVPEERPHELVAEILAFWRRTAEPDGER